MRILHVVQGYYPAIGGTERLIQKVSENLAANFGDEVTVFTTTAYNCELFWRSDQPQMEPGISTLNGVTIRRFPVFNKFNELRRVLAGGAYTLRLPFNDRLRALYNGPLVPGLAAAIAQANADVVAASSFPLLHMHTALKGGRKAGVPVIYYGGIHTADDFGFNRPMIYKAISQADRYIAYTNFEKQYLVKKGIAPDKITPVGVGVDVDVMAQGNGRVIRERFGWAADAPVIAYIGQQVPHKGVDMIMEAMPAIWDLHPEACLLIAGARSTYTAVIEQWQQQLPPHQQKQVGLIINFAEDEKPHLFHAADMVLYPSAHESFGIVFLEAWAAHKPVIGVNIGAIPDVITHEKDGLLIEHRSTPQLIRAIQQLLAHPDTRQQMGAAGHQKVLTHYTWDIVASKFRQIYQQAISSYS